MQTDTKSINIKASAEQQLNVLLMYLKYRAGGGHRSWMLAADGKCLKVQLIHKVATRCFLQKPLFGMGGVTDAKCHEAMVHYGTVHWNHFFFQVLTLSQGKKPCAMSSSSISHKLMNGSLPNWPEQTGFMPKSGWLDFSSDQDLRFPPSDVNPFSAMTKVKARLWIL